MMGNKVLKILHVNLLIGLSLCLLACQNRIQINDENIIVFVDEIECYSLRCNIVRCDYYKPFYKIFKDCNREKDRRYIINKYSPKVFYEVN